MDRLRALSSHLPSVISGNLPSSRPYYRTATDDGSHLPLTKYPPPEWSQPANVSSTPSFPLPSLGPLDERRDSAASASSLNPPGSGGSYVIGPATPVARPTRWTPRTLRLTIVIPIVVLMVLLAVGVEVLYFECYRHNGFPVSGLSKFVDPQFFVSFVPVALIVPLAIFWRLTDHEIQRIQPYITASHGNASAERSVLLDYVNTPRIRLFIDSIRFKHYLVFVSGFIYLATAIFQPITAAIFVVRSTLYVIPDQPVTSTAALGLRSDFGDLVAFAAASGYVDAAITHGLGDAPFVLEGWSVAGFDYKTVFSDTAKNGTLAVQTVATQTDTRCSPVDTIARQGTALTWTGTFQGCSASFSIQDSDETNFGVVIVNNCPVTGNVPTTAFKPVMFWFYGSAGQTNMTFCWPTVKAYDVKANLTLFNNTLSGITNIGEHQVANNVTSGVPLQGQSLNGIFFDPSNDKFIAARNTALQSSVPGAIFRAAQAQAGDSASVFDDRSLLTNLTTKIYTQYLATAGQTNYFLATQLQSPAVLQAWQPRMWMNTLATHAFATIFLVIAVAALVLHLRHTHERRWLFLAGPVGSVGSAVSLTSSARFAGLLNAGDTAESLKGKLEGMHFGIDKDTWQIVVEKDRGPDLSPEVFTYADEGKGKKNNRMSVMSMASVASGKVSVVGTMQHPTALADDMASGRRPSSTSIGGTPLTGTFSIQPYSPLSAYNMAHPPPSGPPPLAGRPQSGSSYHDPYSK